MTRQTILQIIPELETGGAERTALDVAAALTRKGHRALVLSEGGRMVKELEALGGEHILFPARTKNPMKIWLNAARLNKLIKSEGVDLIHARSRAPAWSAYLASRRAGVPFVTTYHGVYKQSSPLKAWYNSVMARGDVVIANSHYTAALIHERHPFARRATTVIHRGSDLAALSREAISEERRQKLRAAWGLSGDETVVLNLARLTAWKGQSDLIEAVALLPKELRPNLRVILAGDDQGRSQYRQKLEEQITSAKLEQTVRLVGHCDDVGAALSLASLSVIASNEPEAFGRAAVEAQAAAVPVIVTDLGAVPETVLAPPEAEESERTGWRVPPRDAAAMAKTIETALQSPAQSLLAITDRAATHVRRSFSNEAMCAATLDVYDKLLNRTDAS